MRGKECGFDAIGLGEGLANGVGISGALMYSTALARYNKTRHAGELAPESWTGLILGG